MPFTHDALVLGRGIAGAVLTETLRERGLRVAVFDRLRPGSASMAAAGVVNPIVLRRGAATWRAADLLPVARSFYTAWEGRSGARCWHPMPLVEVFGTPEYARLWERATGDAATAPFIAPGPWPGIGATGLRAPHGHGTVSASAWLDLPSFLGTQRETLLRERALMEADVQEADIVPIPNGVRIGDRSAPWLVRCTGAFAEKGMPGLSPVKGEVLTVRIPGLGLDRMVHRNVFLLPLGEGLFRTGATFKWDDVWSGPTEEGRAWLLARLRELTELPVDVLDHRAGVRPVSKDRRPIMGVAAPHRAVFNGLGSRGALMAPWCAEHLAAHLFDGAALGVEVDLDRFGR